MLAGRTPSSWPVIDIAAGYLQACLIRRLRHPGHRPAAHLFRALRDLRAWKKDEILDYTAKVLTRMEEDGSADRFANEFIQVDHFYDLIERSDDDHPLSAPEIWGGIAVYGSGWSAPAGAYVGPNPAEIAEVVLKRQAIRARLDDGKIDDNAIPRLDEFLEFVEGEERARLL
jgi:hypothetical protein